VTGCLASIHRPIAVGRFRLRFLHEGFSRASLGVGVLPLACPAASPGFLARGRVRVPLRLSGCGPGRGWSGRCGGRAAGGLEEVEPFALAVPLGFRR